MSDDPAGCYQHLFGPEHCLPQIHRWRPRQVDNPGDMTIWAGQQCYCGLRMLMIHACECGNEHLREVQTGSVKIDGGIHGKAS